MRAVMIVISACLSLAACTGEAKPPLVATDVLITEPMPGARMSAGYVSLNNNSSDAIRISRVESPQFETVEIHESLLQDGVARMRRIEELTIAANSTLALQRGGKHLMLMRPKLPLTSVTLLFYDADTLLLTVQATVTKRNN